MTRYSNIDGICLSPSSSIHEVMACIDQNAALGIALIVDEEGKLINAVTDGDVRRAILAGLSLEQTVEAVLEQKRQTPVPRPITAPIGSEHSVLIELMNERMVRQIILVNEAGRVVDLVTMNNLLPDQVLPLQAVVMAGGAGTRLRPLTNDLPKPMLPVGDRPLLELIIDQLRESGIHRVNITTHYKEEKIIEHFGDGSDFGVELNYVSEDLPLGTAGALGLMGEIEEPMLVVNGDILTGIDYRTMLSYHLEHKADLTVGVRQYDLQVPYGVVECEGTAVTRLAEKPWLKFFVNAGIYLLQPSVYKYIPNGESFDMTDLINHLLVEKRSVVSFPIREYWLDIGQPVDYEQAQQDVKKGKFQE